jgi:hypothetical protein
MQQGILTSVHPEMVDFARIQGGRQIQTGGILVIFRGFESAAQRRNRVKDAVYGWTLTIKFLCYEFKQIKFDGLITL